MGRMLGAFDGSEELDRPDLNKCPDCNCFFAGETCPLCGKVCPEEYRAGNRKPVKHKKQKRGGSGRVTFVEWYHSWWFIVLMIFVFPIVGLILLLTSPHSKRSKIIFASIAAVCAIVVFIGTGPIVGTFKSWFTSPVDTSMTKVEYIAACEEIDAEDFYRSSTPYKGKFITLELSVIATAEYVPDYYDANEYTTCYICTDDSGAEFYIIIRDCSQDGAKNFIKGDKIRIWGEGAEPIRAYGNTYGEYQEYYAPTINAAYIEIQQNMNM